MFNREFFRHNWWQKLLSLFFAILIWFTVRQGVERGGGPPIVPDSNTRAFEHLPIHVLTLASQLEHLRVSPSEVTVVLRGRPDTLNRLRPQDVEVYVNLADPSASTGMRRPVRVNAPGAQVGSVSPQEVLIERLPASDSQRPSPP